MDPLRIANCSGFYGDRRSAAREMVEGGPIDYLTGDYLAELTMALLWRARQRRPETGYATTFLSQMEEILGICLDRRIRVVVNAGGLNPEGLADALSELADRLGLPPVIASVSGDDLLDRLSEVNLTPFGTAELPEAQDLVTANAYQGCWGIASALGAGADIVVTGRVTDASLVMGPAAHHFGWGRDDRDRLAGALVAGHAIECGAQVTGGNFSFFDEVSGLDHVGFPLVEMGEDGSFVVTKHPGTGGVVTEETVIAQMLYEIAGPRYPNPDVTARFDTVRLEQDGENRVRVSGVVGESPPASLKVALNHMGGYRNQVTFVLTGLDIEEKAAAVEVALWGKLGGRHMFADTDVQLLRWDRPGASTNHQAMAHLRFTIKDADAERVGRRFSGAAVELALASYPGFFVSEPPRDASPYAVYTPALVDPSLVPARIRMGGRTWEVTSVVPDAGSSADPIEAPPSTPPADEDTVSVPLGRVAGARSGDKGGDANVGVWVRHPDAFGWLDSYLTVDRLRALMPETEGLAVARYRFPNLRAVNFVVEGLLGEGVASSTRVDPQAKSLGEFLRSRFVEVPRWIAERAGTIPEQS